MQKFHPALWLWGITNTDDGYLLWSWADKWPFCEVTLPSSKKVEIVLGLKTISCFQLTPLIMTTQTKSTHIARLRRYWNSWKGEFSGQDSGFFYMFDSCLSCSSCWGPSIACFFFLLMFLEQKILRPPHWTTIRGEKKSNTTCHQKQTLFNNKEMWFLFIFPEKFFQDTYCVDLHSRRKIMRVLSLNFLMSSFYVIYLYGNS